MKTGEIVTAFKTQTIHDIAGDPGSEAVFEFNEFPGLTLLLLPVQNPVELHFLTFVN
jgi:hypothetical protein